MASLFPTPSLANLKSPTLARSDGRPWTAKRSTAVEEATGSGVGRGLEQWLKYQRGKIHFEAMLVWGVLRVQARPGPAVMQNAIDYACWRGADCTQIMQSGACYQPSTIGGEGEILWHRREWTAHDGAERTARSGAEMLAAAAVRRSAAASSRKCSSFSLLLIEKGKWKGTEEINLDEHHQMRKTLEQQPPLRRKINKTGFTMVENRREIDKSLSIIKRRQNQVLGESCLSNTTWANYGKDRHEEKHESQ
uniref:X8 domain-containing protein n=1 Tax=Oryza barthii TaxID=65489 RepID=A0A0D3EIV3_9ORYZ